MIKRIFLKTWKQQIERRHKSSLSSAFIANRLAPAMALFLKIGIWAIDMMFLIPAWF